MKATALEYRMRYLLHGILYALGFIAPWNYALHLDPSGPNAHVWGLLAINMSKAGMGNISTAFNLLLIIGIVFAFAGAGLRTWGSAYLGNDVVQDGGMHVPMSPTPFAGAATPGVLTAGPFRYLRNPLYLGTFLHTLALSLLMPRSGAIFAIVAIGLLQIRLTLAEETFLAGKIGEGYGAYSAQVPRFVPRLRTNVLSSGQRPRWPQAFLGEAYMWLVAFAMAFAGWRYNASLLTQCVLVAAGVSLVLKAFTPRPQGQQLED